MICGPRITSSPTSPGFASVRPLSSSTILESVPGIGTPMLPVFRTPDNGFMCVTGEASDSPNPSTIRDPVIASKRRNTSCAKGAEPQKTTLHAADIQPFDALVVENCE